MRNAILRNHLKWLNLVKLTWNTPWRLQNALGYAKTKTGEIMTTNKDKWHKKKNSGSGTKIQVTRRRANKRHGHLILFGSSWNLSWIHPLLNLFTAEHMNKMSNRLTFSYFMNVNENEGMVFSLSMHSANCMFWRYLEFPPAVLTSVQISPLVTLCLLQTMF